MDIRLQEIAQGAAGLYFLTYDNSTIPSVPNTTHLRCVMTNFKKGPVNNLVYISRGDVVGFKALFGDIDKRDERNGNFSHRTCLWLLENGPIVVCNLRKFDDDKDITELSEIATRFNESSNGVEVVEIPYKDLYNTDRLWYYDNKKLLKHSVKEDSNFIKVSNTDVNDVSFFIRKSPISGYDLTIKEYYTRLGLEIPTFVNPNDKCSDFIVDVFVFKTNLSDNIRNMSNENYGYLFTESGLKLNVEQNGLMTDSLSILKTVSDAQFVGSYTGSLIPGFVGMNREIFYIEQILNAQSSKTGLLFKIDEEQLEVVGDWQKYDEDEPQSLSEKFSSKYRKPYALDLVGHGISQSNDDELEFLNTDILSYKIGKLQVGEIKQVFDETGDIHKLKLQYDDNSYGADVLKFPIMVNPASHLKNEFYVLKDIQLFENDSIVDEFGNITKIKQIELITDINIPLYDNEDIVIMNNVFKITIDDVMFIDKSFVDDVVEDESIYTMYKNEESGFKLVFAGSSYKIKQIEDFNNVHLNSIVLKSYKPRNEQFTNGTSIRQNEILDLMNQPNLVKGLKNAKNLRFRYIIDAFKTFIEPNYKHQYTQLVKELSEKSTMFCRFIGNEASFEDMANSINPYFKETPDSIFDTRFVAEGGNKKLFSSNKYTKPVDGDVYSFFFGPGLRVNHQGTEIIAPPAGLVGKAFLNKYTNKFPYSVTANNTGILNGSGVIGIEEDFDIDDRKYLEQVGYNAIIDDIKKGLVIYGNNTAQTKIKTDLSKIHVSELIAFIQEQFMSILSDYNFEWNDVQNRLEIKKRADRVMQTILDNRGIYWFENICNSVNNNQEIIENDMGILDTRIVVAKAGEKWVHRTYLERGSNILGFELL